MDKPPQNAQTEKSAKVEIFNLGETGNRNRGKIIRHRQYQKLKLDNIESIKLKKHMKKINQQ